MSSDLNLQILSLSDAKMEPFLSKWHRLANSAAYPNPYWSPGICLPALETFAGHTVKIAALYKNDAPIALAPIETHRIIPLGAKISVLWQHPYLPLGNPLFVRTEPESFGLFFKMLVAQTKTPLICPHIDTDILNAVIAEGCLFPHKIEQRLRAAIMSDGQGKTQYLIAGLSKRRRSGMNRHMRRLEDTGNIILRFSQTAPQINDDLERFLILERSGWKGRNGTALLNKQQHADFARRIVAAMAASNACYIASLNLDGKAIASLIMFRDQNRHFCWKIAFDETYGAHSPGLQLLSRFSEPFIDSDDPFFLDSCSTPDNETANMIMPARIESQTVILANEQMKITAKVAQGLMKTQGRLKQTLKTMVKEARSLR